MAGANGIEDERSSSVSQLRRQTAEQAPVETSPDVAGLRAMQALVGALPSWLKFLAALGIGGGGALLGGEYLSEDDQAKLKADAVEAARLNDKVEAHEKLLQEFIPTVIDALGDLKTEVAIIRERMPEKKKATR